MSRKQVDVPKLRVTVRSEADPRVEEFARRVAATQARGNVALQAGNFETKEEIDARRERLADYQF